VAPDATDAGIAVIVVNFGSSTLLRTNLVPLSRALKGATVVVVDNYSSLAETDRVRALANRYGWIVVLEENLGFGVGMNLGASAAIDKGCDSLLLLNPDATIGLDAVRRLAAVSRADPMTLVSPTILRPDRRIWFGGSWLSLADGRTSATMSDENRIAWVSGACLMVSKDLYETTGGFGDGYFLYWEDIDLSFRVLESGGNLLVLADCHAIHNPGGTQHTRRPQTKSATYVYYNTRNRLLFAARNLPDQQLIQWINTSRAESWRILVRGGGRLDLFGRPRAIVASIRGLRDGRAIARAELDRRRHG
jgi:GT2 family glycosyltransferase